MKRSVWLAAAAAGFLAVSVPAVHAQALRPEIGKPLEKAEALLRARRFPEAMAQVRAADAVRNKTAEESFVIEQTRGAIAQTSGDTATASKVYQDLLSSGRVPPAEQVKLLMAEASMAYGNKNYPAAIDWMNKYFKAGGNDPAMHNLLIQTYFVQKDYANAAKLQGAQVAAEMKAGQKPTEQQLQVLAASQDGLGDKAHFQTTMMQLVYFYPTSKDAPGYWQNLIHNVQTKPGFNDRLNLDIDRFEAALGTLTKPDDIMEMTELALQVPLPGEAKAIVDKGYADNILGQGAEASRHQRLRDLVNKTYADQQKKLGTQDADAATDHDGNRLLSIGEIYVSYGNFTKGIPIMEAAIKKDSLRHPEDAKLHLGLAYLKAGQKAKAVQVLRTVGGKDGAADIARLWTLYIGHV